MATPNIATKHLSYFSLFYIQLLKNSNMIGLFDDGKRRGKCPSHIFDFLLINGATVCTKIKMK